MFDNKEWNTLLSFWTHELWSTYEFHKSSESEDRQKRLESTAEFMVRGATVVVMISTMERVVLDILRAQVPGPHAMVNLDQGPWRQALQLDATWDGWPVVDGMVALRHCFAHEFGRLTTRQKPKVLAFEKAVASGSLSVTSIGSGDTVVIKPFFRITSNDDVEMFDARAVRVCWGGLINVLSNAKYL